MTTVFACELTADGLVLRAGAGDSSVTLWTRSNAVGDLLRFDSILRCFPTSAPSRYSLLLRSAQTAQGLEPATLTASPVWVAQHITAFQVTPTPQFLDIVVNLKAGPSQELLEQSVRDIERDWLGPAGVSYRIHTTQGPGDAGRIGQSIIEDQGGREGSTRTIMVVGGDGTIHELLNGINLELAKVEVILIPHGTANALYYSLFPPESPATPSDGPLARFYSLMSYLLRETPARPLSLAANKLSSSSAEIITSVVTSAALHASILLDSEVLRATMGMERFKVAAMQNAGTWWKGALRLKGDVQQYDPTVAGFLPIHSAVPGAAGVGHDLVEGEVNIDGPFSYFVSTLVDRFEPTFIVAPLRSTARPSTIDVILIRPLRDAAIRELKEQGIGEKELGEEFIKSVWKVTGGMYDGGKHIDARYEDGSVIVEYFRCSSFEWTPTASDDLKSNLVCLDGALEDLGRGGSLSTRAIGVSRGSDKGAIIWR